jgi:N-acyl-D-amino-acid deacylase
VLIRGATVCDGSGGPARQADVLVRSGRVVAVGEAAAGEADGPVLDAGGLVLAPGFIDLHSHADFTLPTFPRAANSLSQGVTTEVVGLCGFSPAPISPIAERAEQLRDMGRGIGPDLDWGWLTFGDFLDRLDEAHPAVNVVPLVGHGTLRINAMGMQDRPSTPAERESMRTILSEALADGAWGMSTGLIYAPGVFANTDELLDVGESLKQADAIYVSHIRNEGDGLLEAVDEALTIGERLGIRSQVSHLKATGQRNLGLVRAAIEHIESARARGVRAHCDVYPYTAGSTFLHQLLPPWVKDGGIRAMVERLQVANQRQRIRHDLEHGLPGWGSHLHGAGGWHNIMISSVINPRLSWALGRRVSELAPERQADPLDLVLDLLVDDGGATVMVLFIMNETDVADALRYSAAGIGSDQLGVTSDTARVHPRAYGTFTRVLGWGVREQRLFGLEEAVHRMTGLPARIMGIAERGRVSPGAVADLTLFDPNSIRDAATYEEPTRLSEGVAYVFMGGEMAVDRGQVVSLDRGRVLRRGR